MNICETAEAYTVYKLFQSNMFLNLNLNYNQELKRATIFLDYTCHPLCLTTINILTLIL